MIVCLGWGSLIWRPGDLPVGDWRDDGPEIKVEFVRESTDHRLTLVLARISDFAVVPYGHDKSARLNFRGSDARNPATEGDTLWVNYSTRRFSSRSTGS